MGRYWFRSTLSRSPIADRRSPIADRRSPIADRIARIFTYPLTVPAPEEAPRNRKGAEGFGVQRSRVWRGTLDHALSLRRTTHDARRTTHDAARRNTKARDATRPHLALSLSRTPAFFCAFARLCASAVSRSVSRATWLARPRSVRDTRRTQTFRRSSREIAAPERRDPRGTPIAIVSVHRDPPRHGGRANGEVCHGRDDQQEHEVGLHGRRSRSGQVDLGARRRRVYEPRRFAQSQARRDPGERHAAGPGVGAGRSPPGLGRHTDATAPSRARPAARFGGLRRGAMRSPSPRIAGALSRLVARVIGSRFAKPIASAALVAAGLVLLAVIGRASAAGALGFAAPVVGPDAAGAAPSPAGAAAMSAGPPPSPAPALALASPQLRRVRRRE